MRDIKRESVIPDGTTEKLRLVVHKSGGTKQVAARAGVALSTLGSYLAGGEMKLTTAKLICAACGVSLAWLIGESRSAELDGIDTGSEELIQIPCARPQSDAGRDDPACHIAFSADWVRTYLDRAPAQLLALEAQGSAMEPTVHQGDLLLIDTSSSVISSLEIHVVEVGGELLVRRLERCLDGSIIIRTDNDRFLPQTLAGSDRDALRVVGRVVWKGSSTPL